MMLASRFPITCPVCREPDLLESAGAGGLTCRRCGAEYPVVDGVPHLVPQAEGDEHKSRQVEFFDEEADPAFELSRPYGTPAFHAWLLREKFRHSISGIEELLPGATVLTVCGGSGMDGESLARAGADVAVSDISLRAAQRAEERGRRYGVQIAGVAADAEHLPFPDRSVDIVYVHDGLHHLARPEAGLAEMARVARLAVSVTEPADAAATQLAVLAGVALEEEEAGNRVERLSIEQVTGELARHGFAARTAQRYAMFYRHEPGLPMRFLSRRRLTGPARRGFQLANQVGGRVGNKLVVTAVRR